MVGRCARPGRSAERPTTIQLTQSRPQRHYSVDAVAAATTSWTATSQVAILSSSRTAPTTQSDTWTSPSTAPATKSDTWPSPSTAPTTKSDTWASPSTAPATQNDSHAWSCHIWNVISNARSNKSHPPNSPHTAPATQNDHPTSGRNLRKTAETSFPMRGRSDHDPRPFRSRSETVPVSPQPATQQRLLFALRTSILYWKMQHFELRLSFQISPSSAPTTQSDTWTSPSTAPATKSDTWTSPSTAPTTKSDTWTSPSTAPTTTILLIDSTITQRSIPQRF